MVAYLWISLLGGSALTLIGVWLVNYLARFTAHIPEEVAMFLQPTNWEQVDTAFEPARFRQSYETELSHFFRSRDRHLRRDLHSRIALGRQCLQGMTENVQAMEFAATDDLRVAVLWRKDLDSESSVRSTAIAALQKAAEANNAKGWLTTITIVVR